MSVAAQVVGLQEGANKGRLPNVPDERDVVSPAVYAEILPLAIARPRSCPRVYQRSRVCGSACVT
jgi:hypothetical protein